ncbi:MAG: hypothetical protein RMK57_08160 [Bryobacterales bacterium]|nr:hypothetical protein [Bryobacteraceae bacterium]MDW8354489.1 hypothetical protein [Bryobacterales bacterium]
MRTLALGACFAAIASAAAPPFEVRVRELIHSYAYPKGNDFGYATIAARLKLGEDPAWCSRRLIELLRGPLSGDMFWQFQVTAIAYLDQGRLSEPARRALREAWRTYMPFRGDTENHWVLYYTMMYLMAQHWPGEPGERWFNGKSSEENLREAAAWLDSWIRLTTRRGQGEYDCTHYLGVFLLPMSYLAAWAEDSRMRQRARMMLDYLIADYAVENLDGLYVGSHARTDDRAVLERWHSVASQFGYLLFGLGPKPERLADYLLYYALASAYRPPAILEKIATDRSKPYTHYERKRTRNRWRFHDELHGPVYKTTYVRREYAVGSDQGGLLQPVQQHSWDVTWAVPDPRGVQNTFFTLHPYSSLEGLQTYYTLHPDVALEVILPFRPTYDSPDKFLGGSPFEKIVQDHDTVIALYSIPPMTRFPHINGFLSKDLDELVEDPSGWLFLRGNQALIAVRPLQPYVLKPIPGGGQRLFSPHLNNGVVVQVAAASEFANLDAFRKAILGLELHYRLEPAPAVIFRSLRGRRLEFTYGQTPRVDGRPLDYENWPLFGGPFLQAAVDSEELLIQYGTERRRLDFRRNLIE